MLITINKKKQNFYFNKNNSNNNNKLYILTPVFIIKIKSLELFLGIVESVRNN